MDEFVFNWQYKHVASSLRRTLVLQIYWQHFWPLPLIPLQREGRYCIAFINNLFLHVSNTIELIVSDARNNLYKFIRARAVLSSSPPSGFPERERT